MSLYPLKIAALGAALLTSVLSAPLASASESSVSGGQIVQTYKLSDGAASSAIAIHGHVLVPVKELAAALGWSVSWKAGGLVVLQNNGETLSIKLNQKEIITHGQSRQLSEPVTARSGKAYVAVREMALALGAEAVWDAKTRSVNVVRSASSTALDFKYTFSQNAEGWSAGFADLPSAYKTMDFRLQSGQTAVSGGDGTIPKTGFMLSGMNRSDDLFMYLSRKLDQKDGVKANTAYRAKLGFDLIAQATGDSIGVGGSPFGSVYVKAGVLGQEPKAVESLENGGADGFLRLNIDKGNQSAGGKDMPLLGTIESDSPDTPESGYYVKHFEQEFTVTSGPDGAIYSIIGTDSGYEGLTTLYYSNIDLALTEQK